MGRQYSVSLLVPRNKGCTPGNLRIRVVYTPINLHLTLLRPGSCSANVNSLSDYEFLSEAAAPCCLISTVSSATISWLIMICPTAKQLADLSHTPSHISNTNTADTTRRDTASHLKAN
ncbi:hypothetical protein J6590_016256 [Homalodisca vitripennis]|nr:hypothetical protein J6590_016256 [Homalodisca vitripennis]